MDLQTELREAAELSLSGVPERTIETCVVTIFRSTGWNLRQIEQDVPVSDRAADRADIAIKLNDRPFLVAEVKRYGQIREGQSCIRRYCALVRPRLAVVTDGCRWIFYYAGQSDLLEIVDSTVPAALTDVAATLAALGPSNVEALADAGAFTYLDIIARALGDLSEDARKPLGPYFSLTVGAILGRGTRVSAERRRDSGGRPHRPETSAGGSEEAPDLRHTSISAARFGEESVSSWTALVHAAIRHAMVVCRYSLTDLCEIVGAQIVEGELSDKGFRPVVGTNVSVQGMEARRAWRDALSVARATGAPIRVKFRWQDVEGASQPGKTGVLEWMPAPQ